MRGARSLAWATAAMLMGAPVASTAQSVRQERPSVADSFRLGTGGSSLCQMQNLANDPAMRGLFDRSYAIICRDAAAPIGHVHALRAGGDDPAARLATLRAGKVDCPAETKSITLPDAGVVSEATCQDKGNGLPYRVLTTRRGRTTYVAEGLAGYETALTLGLRTIVADRIVPGDLEVAVTEAGDAAAFARVQAGALDPEQALAEGYRRNNSGNYAEAAEFFDILLRRRAESADPNRRYGEYLANRALQKSNLGDFPEADALFAQAAKVPTADPVELRLRRNLETINLLNQGRLAEAETVLDRPIAPVGQGAGAGSTIDAETAAAINADAPMARELGVASSTGLTPVEKATVLDAQAQSLRGTLRRLKGDAAGARAALDTALTQIATVRRGNIGSLARVRAQALAELGALAESQGDLAGAERLLREAIAQLDSEYPQSLAVNAANARLAAFLARRGRTPDALAIYKQVIANTTAAGGATVGFESLIRPYFAVLAREIPRQPALTADFFLASQALLRPGVADTQAVLTRELSSGDDQAAALFRQAVNLSRDVERTRVDLARLASIDNPSAAERTGLDEGRSRLAALTADQAAVQAQLNQYPRYRAATTRATTLAELTAALKPGEAYWKLVAVAGDIYGLYVAPERATAWQAPLTSAQLETSVDTLRASISTVENGQLITQPFDVKAARALYVALAGPVAAELPRVRHLVFEPDGAMLRLPANLLVTEDAGVQRYTARAADPKADAFDFRGVAWLGRTADISTSVSARAFEDVRRTPASAAKRTYLGMGQNAPVPALLQLTGARAPAADGAIDCNWPLSAWNNPISAKELVTAERAIGGGQARVITGPGFSDTAIEAMPDLGTYRVIHFATHGLVAAPRPECPARPALLTSFGDSRSDGLLSFREIYDLKLDADLVILSACDTAGTASVAATREAGVVSGGGRALDGLVRAFVGAGSRSVLASHWPAPDDYQATERLISGLFDAAPGTPVTEALRQAQLKLMDDPATSHPYYWSAFALVGDGAQPVLRTQ